MKNVFVILVLTFSISAFLVTSAEAMREIILNKNTKSISAGNYLEVLEDQSKKMSLAQVKNPVNARLWKKSKWEVPNFGYTESVYWFRMRIVNQDAEKMKWILEIAYHYLDNIKLYIFASNQKTMMRKGGDAYPFHNREILDANHMFQLTLPPNEPQNIYIRVQTSSSMQLPITLYQPISLIEMLSEKKYVDGALFGILFVMAFYNLFIFLSVRDASYFYYVLYSLFTGILILCLNGLSFWFLWPKSPWLANHSVVFFINFLMVILLQFTRTFLNTKKHIKYLDYFIIGLILIEISLTVSSLFLDYGIIIKITNPVSILSVLTCFIGSIITYFKGNKSARFYVIAWIALTAGVVLYDLKAAGILPRIFITEYGIRIGTGLEIILFSFALGDRINILKKEKEQAQQYALEVQTQARGNLEKQVEAAARCLCA